MATMTVFRACLTRAKRATPCARAISSGVTSSSSSGWACAVWPSGKCSAKNDTLDSGPTVDTKSAAHWQQRNKMGGKAIRVKQGGMPHKSHGHGPPCFQAEK